MALLIVCVEAYVPVVGHPEPEEVTAPPVVNDLIVPGSPLNT
jgi:hypothetical protein